MCKKYNKTPVQIALNWLISQKNVTTIVKMTNEKHLKEDIGAVTWKMEDIDIEEIRNSYPGTRPYPSLFPLE